MVPMWLKRWLYKRGVRPNVGSIFYSPSLDAMTVSESAMVSHQGRVEALAVESAAADQPDVQIVPLIGLIRIRRFVIASGPFETLAAATALESTLREKASLPSYSNELDGAPSIYPHSLSIYWAVQPSERPDMSYQSSLEKIFQEGKNDD